MDPLSESPWAARLPALTIPEEVELDEDDQDMREESSERIQTPRRKTEPAASALPQAQTEEHPRPSRNHSPYSRSRFRSSSATTSAAAPPMIRARSLPTVNLQYMSRSPSHSPVRPPSPFRSAPTPTRGNMQRPFDESYPNSSGGITPSYMDIQSIDEDQELDIQPPERDFQGPLSMQVPTHGHTFPRSAAQRRRPASPLHSQAYPNLSPHHSSPMSTFARPASAHGLQSNAVTPPQTPSMRFNEPYPTASLSFSTGSSMPSTPTSLRSRSPSISSLETIPDTPDAEEAAAEAFNMEQIKAAAEAAAETSDSDSESGRKRQGSLDVPGGSWKGRGGNQRKRWSVCGAERRGDFEMETIWEDGS